MSETDAPSKTMAHDARALVSHSDAGSVMSAAQRCEQAKQLYLRGDPLEALEILLPLAQAEASPVRAHATALAIRALDDLADECERRGQYRRAIEYLEQWAALNPRALRQRQRLVQLDCLAAYSALHCHRLRLPKQDTRCVSAAFSGWR
ncbi:MAG: hypothetical protein WHS44_06755 [Fimbriimonadales bacterium]